MLTQSELRQYLDPAIELFFFDTLPSTNRHPPASKHDYALVVTKHQTDGVGKRERTWHSDAQSSLTFSFYHRQHVASPFWQIVVANVVAETLVGVKLKWPNDVMFEGGKCGGILIETHVCGDTMRLVSGIGLNIGPIVAPGNDYSVSYYPVLDQPKRLKGQNLAAKWIAQIANHLRVKSKQHDVAEEISTFNNQHILHQRRVNVCHRKTNVSFSAIVESVATDACLRVRKDDGKVMLLDQAYQVRLA